MPLPDTMRNLILCVALSLWLLSCNKGTQTSNEQAHQVVSLLIDYVWSGHSVGFGLLTVPPYQYVAYYDSTRKMTLAHRKLDAREWQKVQLPETTGWDSHNYQAPLLFAGPGIPENKRVEQLVEFVDIFPTLNEMTGLPALPDQLEGASMQSIIRQENAPWDGRVVSKFYIGLSIKTDHFLYTEWSQSDSVPYARMLFDHARDPDERINIAELPENQELIRSLQQELYENRGKDFNQEVEVME